MSIFHKFILFGDASKHLQTNSPPTLTYVGYQRTIPTSKGHFSECFNQWEPLVATSDGTHRSLVARTSKCGWAIRDSISNPIFVWIALHRIYFQWNWPQYSKEVTYILQHIDLVALTFVCKGFFYLGLSQVVYSKHPFRKQGYVVCEKKFTHLVKNQWPNCAL